MNLGLADKVVLISGGAKGIGAACAELFLAEGAFVAIADIDEVAGKARADTSANGRLICFPADLAEDSRCREAVATTISHFGRLDVLVNNAGVNDAVALDQPPGRFLASLQRNLVPAYALTHYSLVHLREARGAIVNLGSKVAVTGQGATSGYAAAKGGLNALTREWAAALAADGIRVNAVLPAECDTDQYQRWFAAQSDPAATRRAVEHLVPLEHRLTKPEEIAAMVAFLAAPVSSHTTGQIIFVDGGYTHLDRALSADHTKWH